jgi:predicted nucleic acid-binding protein
VSVFCNTTKQWRRDGASSRPARNGADGPRPHNDTWIAACRLVDDLPLATLNTKDFADFAEHEGLTLIGGQQSEAAEPAAADSRSEPPRPE